MKAVNEEYALLVGLKTFVFLSFCSAHRFCSLAVAVEETHCIQSIFFSLSLYIYILSLSSHLQHYEIPSFDLVSFLFV